VNGDESAAGPHEAAQGVNAARRGIMMKESWKLAGNFAFTHGRMGRHTHDYFFFLAEQLKRDVGRVDVLCAHARFDFLFKD
jgi:hypothetical protein